LEAGKDKKGGKRQSNQKVGGDDYSKTLRAGRGQHVEGALKNKGVGL